MRAGHGHIKTAADLHALRAQLKSAESATTTEKSTEDAGGSQESSHKDWAARDNGSATRNGSEVAGARASDSVEAFFESSNLAGSAMSECNVGGSASSAPTGDDNPLGADSSDDELYYPFPLQDSAIQQIHTTEDIRSLRHCLDGLAEQHALQDDAKQASMSELGECALVGIDCEWEPFEKGQPKTPVSILQLALRDQVYLIDLLHICGPSVARRGATSDGVGGTSNRLSAEDLFSEASTSAKGLPRMAPDSPARSSADALTPAAAEVSALIEELMGSEKLIKAGFQLRSDLDRMQQSYPWLPCFRDGLAIAAHVEIVDAVEIVKPVKTAAKWQSPSLSRLVESVLGWPLNKAQQRSHWSRRPLTRQQLLYAANDAHCLVAALDELCKQSSVADAAASDSGQQSLAGASTVKLNKWVLTAKK